MATSEGVAAAEGTGRDARAAQVAGGQRMSVSADKDESMPPGLQEL